ncbi:MAG: hypothetical protein A2W00_03860 [Candidatus Eisenbacteria bacterium RBG_16_71_46]|nr:MAG: hypothetical protein A2W00_03860 [Candidatus Eisenbacteria bacterium RBG_16_71_46]
MEGLNPNAPPPKNTEVTLQRWEYTDPIAVPHPDTLEAVLELKNGSEAGAEAEVEWVLRWRVGPINDSTQAEWEPPLPARRAPAVRVNPGGSALVRLPVDLASKMKAHEPAGAWPWALRVEALVRTRSSGPPLASAEAELQIFPGN